jgi:hypothetical protein
MRSLLYYVDEFRLQTVRTEENVGILQNVQMHVFLRLPLYENFTDSVSQKVHSYVCSGRRNIFTRNSPSVTRSWQRSHEHREVVRPELNA